MEDSDEIEPSLITAIRLARMRDGNMGQSEEIQALQLLHHTNSIESGSLIIS